MTGRVSFVGAGPGAADLITVRGAKRIAEADVVLWAPSVVEAECVREHARPDAELLDFSRLTDAEVVEVYRRASVGKLNVVRLHAGDPALWSGLGDQQDVCRRLALETDVVPGVSQVSAAAASIGRELTNADVAQSLLLAGPETAEHIREFAAHGTTMAISASGARAGLLAEQLRAGGYPDDTPVVVAYKVSLADETVARTTLGGLEACVKEHKLYRTTLFLVGKVFAQPAGRRRSAVVEGDEPVRRARSSKWSTRANRPAGESPSAAAAWSAVHDWQETARTKRSAQARSKAESGDEQAPVSEPVLELVPDVAEPPAESKSKPVVAAAAKRTPTTVRASTTPRKPAGSRTKKTKRAN